MTTYLLNAFSVSMLPEGGVVEFDNLASACEAKGTLGESFISAVGHEPTALVFAELLRMPVPTARISVTLQPGDWVVIGQLSGRLPEGKVLSAEELAALPIRWVRAHVQ